MSRIFLSHHNSNNREALALKLWLESQGWRDEIFLDFDPEAGIKTGTRWKDALVRAGSRCEAVVCLTSPEWVGSAECQTEYRTAWNAKTGQAIGAPFIGHKRQVASVAFSPDGSKVVSASWDQTLRLWDVRKGQPIGDPLRGHKGMVWSVAFSPDGTMVVSRGDDKTLRLWDVRTRQPIG